MAAPLASGDFRSELAREGARAVTPYLTDERFEARWSAALAHEDGAHMLLRSFPGLWWRDLREVDPGRVPPGRALAFGDAHVGNFGFLAFEEGVRFAFNDLDDSGDVEVALDALRYFTSVALSGRGDVAALGRAWAEALDEGGGPVLKLPRDPDRRSMRRRCLAQWDESKRECERGGADGARLPPATAAEADAVARALASRDVTRGYEVREVRRRVVRDGGSGGLDRFWALVRDADGEKDVLELKAMARPGSEEGRGARGLPKRLSTLRAALWPGHSLAPYHRVEVDLPDPGGARAPRDFVVRSRGMRAPAEGYPLGEQVRVLAAVHRRASPAVDARALAAWVVGSVPALAHRWRSLWDRARG